MRLTPDEAARAAAAIVAAERTTDAEIAVVVAPSSDSYHDVPLQWALLVMFAAGAVLVSVPELLVGLRGLFDEGWMHGSYPHGEILTVLLVLLAIKYLLARFVLGLWPVRMLLTPAPIKTRRTRRRAIEVFRIGTERRTASRTGVLLYLSLAEHRAEIVVDEAIHPRVAPEQWGEAMAALLAEVRAGRLADGIVAAVGRIGAVLAEAVPHTGADPNEMPDRVIEL